MFATTRSEGTAVPTDTVPINGYALRALRQSRRMKASTCALVAEVSPSYYSELESGAKVNVSRDVLRRIMDALFLAPEDERALTRWWLVAENDSKAA